jgi:RNA polymerase sigma factor (sigma-70 family)
LKINFQLPDEVQLMGETITQAALRNALKNEDYSIIKPLITAIVNSKGNQRETLFNFFLGGIQFGVEHCVKQTYGYFDREVQEEIFWQGVAYVWENLEDFDENKSKLLTWIWNQVKYGSRNARRKEISAKRLAAKCANNPALIAEEISYSTKRGDSDRSGPLLGTPSSSLESAIGREIDETTKLESAALKQAMDLLKENEKRLIYMRIVDQLEVEEIAIILGEGVTTNQVYVACHRAIKKLKEQYTRKLVEGRATID